MAGVEQADQFLIPLLDGTFGLGQVFECDPGAVFVGLTSLRRAQGDAVGPLHLSDFVAALLVFDIHLQDGLWPIVGYDTLPDYAPVSGERRAKKALLIEDTPLDPALIEAFVNACHGLYPWDGFPDPGAFDRLLISAKARPDAARMKQDMVP